MPCQNCGAKTLSKLQVLAGSSSCFPAGKICPPLIQPVACGSQSFLRRREKQNFGGGVNNSAGLPPPGSFARRVIPGRVCDRTVLATLRRAAQRRCAHVRPASPELRPEMEETKVITCFRFTRCSRRRPGNAHCVASAHPFLVNVQREGTQGLLGKGGDPPGPISLHFEKSFM